MTISACILTLFVCVVGFKKTARADDVPTRYQGKTAFQWHRLAVIRRVERDRARSNAGAAIRANRRSRFLMLHRVDVVEAIRLASRAYDVDFGLLYRRAQCESVLSATAKNRSSTASGLFQFLTSTWASTPYARESIWSPYANALAAAWMQSVGRGGEWVCRG